MEKKVALITGCSSGIGRDLAERLRAAGYAVAASARRLASLDKLEADMKLALDVRDDGSARAAVGAVLERYGRIDLLVNNAGYAVNCAVEEASDALLLEMLDTNAVGAVRLIRAAAPAMRAAGRGVIVNVSSISGLMSMPAGGAYCATKYALEALSDAARQELAPFGVRVLLVEPGPIRTEFDARNRAASRKIAENRASPYFRLYRANEALAATMRGREPGPEIVSEAIIRAVEGGGRRPRFYAGVAPLARLLIRMPATLRDRLWAGALERAAGS